MEGETITKGILMAAQTYGTISAQELVKVVDPERGDSVTSIARNLAKHIPEYLKKEVLEDKTRTYTYVQPEKSPSEVADVYRDRVKKPKKRRTEKPPVEKVVKVGREMQLEKEAKEAADKALEERPHKRIEAERTAAAARKLKARRIAAASLVLLLLLAGAIATHVWLRPAAATTDLNKLTQTQRAHLGMEPVRPEIENGSLRQANDVVKPEAAHARDALQAPPWTGPVTVRGEIAHGLKIEMKLVREGSKLLGSYYYECIGKGILVRGTLEETGNMVLEEFVKGHKTGIFMGKFVSDDRIEGKWSKPDSIRSRHFFLVSTGLLRSMPVSHDQGRIGQQQVEHTLGKIRDQSLLSGDFGHIMSDLSKNRFGP